MELDQNRIKLVKMVIAKNQNQVKEEILQQHEHPSLLDVLLNDYLPKNIHYRLVLPIKNIHLQMID